MDGYGEYGRERVDISRLMILVMLVCVCAPTGISSGIYAWERDGKRFRLPVEPDRHAQ